ncbi:unnamed protein product [Colias eurytheme]|nr:unnamed protein product [Colias eurytheme]
MNPNDHDFERRVTEILEQTDSDISDQEDRELDQNYCLESDHDTSSEIAESEGEDQLSEIDGDSDDELLINIASSRSFYLGKKVRNIQPFKCGSNKTRDCTEEVDFWNILFSEDILHIVDLHTNRRNEAYKKEDRPELKDIDVTELRALIGCILKIEDAEPEPSTSTKLDKRGTCIICPAKKKNERHTYAGSVENQGA